MKIAFIVPLFPSLSQTFVLNQVTGLIDLGHEVTIFARSAQKTAKVHADIKKYNLVARTCYYGECYDTMPKNKVFRIIHGVGYILKYLKLRPVPILRACNIFVYGKEAVSFSVLYRIIPFLPYGRFDIVYCHFGPCGILGVLLKELDVLGNKVITVFHGYDLTSYLKKNGEDVYSGLFSKGDLFLPISNNWKNRLIELGCSKDKIRVHRMGIDIKKFKYNHCSKNLKNKENIAILTVARLVEKKGVEFGIKSVTKMVHEYPKIQYKIAGNGPLKSRLENLIDELGVKDNVTLLGWQSQEDITQLMQQADILLVPSVTSSDGDMEGIPVVLMEACAQGLPVISTFHSGIPELIEDGITGVLVAEREVDQLAKKFEWIISNPDARLRMARAARYVVMEHYEITGLNRKLVSLFEELAY